MPARPGVRRVVAACLLVAALAGCAGDPPQRPVTAPPPSPTVTASAPTSTPTPTPTPVVLRPDGTAADNLPFFEQTIADYVGAYGRGERAILVGHLRSVGFDGARIESGWATTPNGLQEVSIDVAVRFGEDCLVATVREDRWTTAVMPVLSSGTCLIGDGFGEPG